MTPLNDKSREELIDQVFNNEELRYKFFDYSPHLNVIVSDRGYFVDCNDNWEKELGWNKEDLTNRSFLTLVHPDDLKKTMEVFQADIDAEDGVVEIERNFTNRYRKKDGSYIRLYWTNKFYVVDGVTYSYAVVTPLKDGNE